MVQQVSRPASGEKEAEVTTTCRHHWIIEVPVGPVSRGVCQQCSEVREFKNYIESAPWGEDASGTQAAPRDSGDSSPNDSDDGDEI